MILPETAVLAQAFYLNEAYEGLLAAAKALRYERADLAVVALQYTISRLGGIEAVLLAVVEEQGRTKEDTWKHES